MTKKEKYTKKQLKAFEKDAEPIESSATDINFLAPPLEKWVNGCLTFDEIKNIIEGCNVKDVKIKRDYLTISFVPKNVTGKAWKDLKEKMHQIIKKLSENAKSING